MEAVTFAAVGDVHGSMRMMVRLVEAKARKARRKVSFVLQVGDFESIRDDEDLATVHGPAKYRKPGDFARYVRGEEQFPWPLYFIGGNHEAHRYLESFPQGGAVAPRCHYVGRVGAFEAGGLRVAGLSGIHEPRQFRSLRPEVFTRGYRNYPYFNEGDIEQAIELGSADVLLLHDWPRCLGTGLSLQQRRVDVFGEGGNEMAQLVVDALSPRLVLCGHMHFSARMQRDATSFAALASVDDGADSVALFERDPGGAIREIAC
jgi:Icc-related predicted phosphoesterase